MPPDAAQRAGALRDQALERRHPPRLRVSA